ncbi:hypothetical protein AWJ20_2115 [Sugiyamaella lignohabitans]|uniref:Metal-dependent protein hydrolase n=1 Tax=Sugiyamaella lignohabitans TaxID=796027 RepID=A0A161HFW5_9ASCO|nr:uncharacterized protein AWJ20_2115 [Sugiyamaella lignohabitans]ANB14520.1 hypothetical protein AWJ20_2115 [Sugiyamaella lignohabitans]
MKIGTHSGTFHADESLAVYMLRLLPRFKDAELLRSRDNEQLETCDIIVDVGGKYEAPKYFDHHQREFNDTFDDEHKTRLSSAGLIYKHFGKEIIAQLTEVSVDDASIDVLYNKIYNEFIEAIDANDNGISAYPEDTPSSYRTGGITLPSLVSKLNPLWTEPNTDEVLDAKFLKASELMGTAFVSVVENYGKGWYPAKQHVQAAFDARDQYGSEGRIVVFDTFVPWKEHLYTIEKELGKEGEVLYVLYSDGKGWRIQAVAQSSSSFTSRKPLPEPWRGARDEKMSEITGVPGCVFTHVSGFIGGHKTREGALELAKLALQA